jgi:GT2 family glycosyltransferase
MGMEKIDVAVQSYKKPELLFYTLLSLKKTCGNYISTIYIDDDCSDDGSITFFKSNIFVNSLLPIQVKVRENTKRSGYSTTIMTKALLKKKPFIPQLQTLLLLPLKHLSFHKTEDDIRYQWAINQTDKKYLLIIHDDIVFYDNVIEKYLDCFLKDKKLIIVGDLGGSKRCPFGPCGEKGCSPDLISSGYRPCLNWPITGTYGFPKNLSNSKQSCG